MPDTLGMNLAQLLRHQFAEPRRAGRSAQSAAIAGFHRTIDEPVALFCDSLMHVMALCLTSDASARWSI